MKSLKRPARPAPAAPAPRPHTPRALSAEIEAELAQIAAGAGCELVRAEWKGGVLRLVLDRPEGITLGDCERVSKQASALLDVVDFGGNGGQGERAGGRGEGEAGSSGAGNGKGRYILEVSSPGLDRQLDRPADYERFLGHLARVTFLDSAARSAQLEEPSLPAGVAAADGASPGSEPRSAEPRKTKKTVVARLAEHHRADGSVVLVEDGTGRRHVVGFEDILSARLEIEL